MAANPPNRSSSQRVVDDENLLTEILLRLPTKPLVKSKSVCKQWNSIISSPSFAQIHTLLHPPAIAPTSGIFLRKPVSTTADSSSPYYHYHFFSLPAGPVSLTQFQFPLPAPKILQSCNGLLLLCSGYSKNYYLYNPANSQFKTLPSLLLGESSGFLGVSVAFDPSRLEGYGVVCVATTEGSAYSYRILLHRSSDVDSGGSWKELEGNPLNAPYDTVFSNGVYWNGAVHWIGLREDSVFFDVEKECLGRFPSSPISPRKRGYRNFCGFNGKLHYVDCDEYRSPVCKVFALVSYGDGWALRYNVDIPEMFVGERCGFSMLCLACEENRVGDGKRLEMVVHMRRKIWAYDLEGNTWRQICGLESWDCSDASSNKLLFGWFDAYPYSATLALI